MSKCLTHLFWLFYVRLFLAPQEPNVVFWPRLRSAYTAPMLNLVKPKFQ